MQKNNEKLKFCNVRDVRIAHFQSFNSLALVLSPKYQNCMRGPDSIRGFWHKIIWSVKSGMIRSSKIQNFHDMWNTGQTCWILPSHSHSTPYLSHLIWWQSFFWRKDGWKTSTSQQINFSISILVTELCNNYLNKHYVNYVL